MNIEKLRNSEIREFKNYKVACEFLEEEIKGGKSKKLQLENWTRYFEYHKEGNKIIIDKVNDKVVEKQSRKEINIITNINKGVYSKEMFPLVKEFVRGSELEYHSKSALMNGLGLKNENYDIAYNNEEKVAEILSNELNLNITEDDIKTILSSMWCISQEKIHKAFLNLERLKYIYSYENKLFCIYNKEINKVEVVVDNYEELSKCVYEGKIQALADYFIRNPKKNFDDYLDLMNVLKDGLDTDKIEDVEKLNNKLNTEIYLRGLGENARKLALKSMHDNGYSYVGNFHYAYAYIKNEDIEWDKEILDIAKRNIHIESFKRAVKEDYLLDTFLEKWFSSENEKIDNYKCSDSKKTVFKQELKKHKKEKSEIINILFDIFVSDEPKIKIQNIKETKVETILPF